MRWCACCCACRRWSCALPWLRRARAVAHRAGRRPRDRRRRAGARRPARGARTTRTATWRSTRIRRSSIDDRDAARRSRRSPCGRSVPRTPSSSASSSRRCPTAVALLPVLLPAARADAVDARALHAGRLRPRDGARRGRATSAIRTADRCSSASHATSRIRTARSAEFAVVVADDWQKRGVARALIERLVDVATHARLRAAHRHRAARERRDDRVRALARLHGRATTRTRPTR